MHSKFEHLIHVLTASFLNTEKRAVPLRIQLVSFCSAIIVVYLEGRNIDVIKCAHADGSRVHILAVVVHDNWQPLGRQLVKETQRRPKHFGIHKYTASLAKRVTSHPTLAHTKRGIFFAVDAHFIERLVGSDVGQLTFQTLAGHRVAFFYERCLLCCKSCSCPF